MLLDDPSPLVRRALAEVFAGSEARRRRWCMRWPAISRTSPRRCCSVRRCCSTPIWSRRSRAARPQRQIAIAGARQLALLGFGGDRRGRLRRGLPDAAGERARPRSCRSRSTASCSASAIWPRSATSCRATTCRRRPGRRWWSSCRRRSPTSSPRANGSPRSAPAASPARPARRPPLRSPPSPQDGEVRPLIRHLRESGQLNAGLILRSLLSGNVDLFEEALAELAQVPLTRVAGIVHDRRGAGFRALYDKAGLPASTFPAFREALEAMREEGFMFEPGRRQPAQAPHHRAHADALRERSAGRDRAAADAAAPLRRRSRARRGAAVLRRAGGGWAARRRSGVASGRGLGLLQTRRPLHEL